MNARAVAVRVLERVDTSREVFANEALSKELAAQPKADPRDRALATELTYGVLRWRRRLDHALAPHVRRGLARLEPIARALLRVGAYQVLMLDRVPPPIAVSATQDAARALRAGRLTGLLNAVLRRVAAAGERLPEGSSDDALALRTSLPTWLIPLLRETYGDDAAGEAEALRRRALLTVRPTAARGGTEATAKSLAAEGFSVAAGEAGTLVVRGPGDPFATRAFREGGFVPQDPASLAIVDLLGEVAGTEVLDLCAGRGIKTTALADRGARVTAVDVSAGKLAEARTLADRLGVAERITTRVADVAAADFALGRDYQEVLVDAPCSGLGTLRRHPEIAWRLEPQELTRHTELQARLLASAARHLAPGGRLVYAVCSFARAEGAPPVPPELEPLGPLRLWRPSEGYDAFQAQLYRRR